MVWANSWVGLFLEPDYKIANDADVIVTGEDQQLRRAVELLLKQIDSK